MKDSPQNYKVYAQYTIKSCLRRNWNIKYSENSNIFIIPSFFIAYHVYIGWLGHNRLYDLDSNRRKMCKLTPKDNHPFKLYHLCSTSPLHILQGKKALFILTLYVECHTEKQWVPFYVFDMTRFEPKTFRCF